jgi:hypothetical protein
LRIALPKTLAQAISQSNNEKVKTQQEPTMGRVINGNGNQSTDIWAICSWLVQAFYSSNGRTGNSGRTKNENAARFDQDGATKVDMENCQRRLNNPAKDMARGTTPSPILKAPGMQQCQAR